MKHETQNTKHETRTVADSPVRRFADSGFSLVEVLLAIFILGIGLIMVASIFPVGADWTRQATEESIGQVIAQNALSVIKQHYGPGGNLYTYPGIVNGNPVTIAYVSPINLSGKPWNTLASGALVASPGGPGGAGRIAGSPFELQALPAFADPLSPLFGVNAGTQHPTVPVSERAYRFGATNPFPVPTSAVANCSYFWTALVRLNPGHKNPAYHPTNPVQGILPWIDDLNYSYDLYILVFRKGTPEVPFKEPQFQSVAGPGVLIPGACDVTPGVSIGAVGNNSYFTMVPTVAYANYKVGTYTAGNTPPVQGSLPDVGGIGIGVMSGTVFRQGFDAALGSAVPRPNIVWFNNGSVPEPIIISPPAAGTNASPLIYVYQTTLTQ